jgi:hypothetical protein
MQSTTRRLLSATRARGRKFVWACGPGVTAKEAGHVESGVCCQSLQLLHAKPWTSGLLQVVARIFS